MNLVSRLQEGQNKIKAIRENVTVVGGVTDGAS